MSMPTSPQMPNTAEPVPVQLTRIEGVINLIAYQQGEMRDDVKDLRLDLTKVTTRVVDLEHRLASASGAAASWRSWLPTIAMLASAAFALIAVLKR